MLHLQDEILRNPVIPIEVSTYQEEVASLAAESAHQLQQRIESSTSQATLTPCLDFAESVARGLGDSPRWLDCRYLYDARGSQIFERICEQPEYYLTRTEGAILAAVGLDIAAQTGRVTLIELGSGSSVKTRLLLEAYSELYGTACYAPVDISSSVLEHAEAGLNEICPDVDVDPLHGTYDEAFPLFRDRSPSMLLFLGSTLGNLNEQESLAFWQRTADSLTAGDFCLLGIDINADRDSINAAYNDAAGWSHAFTRNLFARMNRELGSSLDEDVISHVAEFNRERSRVEIFARFDTAQTIDIKPLGLSFQVAAGERIMTEISRKYRLQELVSFLEDFALRPLQIYTDSENRFAVLLLRRR